MSGPLPADRGAWLSLLEEAFDPETEDRLDALGVGPGWHVLEVGAGAGSVAARLADRVGDTGRVVAADIDTTLLERLSHPGVETVRHDVTTDDFPVGSFDLVHCRAVLVHLLGRRRAIGRMAGWLRPGGLLLAEEPWIDVGLLSPDRVVVEALRALGRTAPHMDGSFARRLPGELRAAGLDGVQGEGRIVFFRGDSKEAAVLRGVLAEPCRALVAEGRLDQREVDRLMTRLSDPEEVEFGWPRIAAWGRRIPTG